MFCVRCELNSLTRGRTFFFLLLWTICMNGKVKFVCVRLDATMNSTLFVFVLCVYCFQFLFFLFFGCATTCLRCAVPIVSRLHNKCKQMQNVLFAPGTYLLTHPHIHTTDEWLHQRAQINKNIYKVRVGFKLLDVFGSMRFSLFFSQIVFWMNVRTRRK